MLRSTPISTKGYYSPDAIQTILIAVLLFAVTLFAILYTRNFFIPTSHFHNYSITASVLESLWEKHSLYSGLLFLAICIGTLFLLIRAPWQAVAIPELRLFILLVAAMVVWRNSTYELNYIYEQTHSTDRLLLIGLFVLSIWRPVFILFLPVVIFFLQSQFLPDAGYYSTAHLSMPIKILFAFSVYLLFCTLFKKQFNQALIWFITIIIMAHYWVPAYEKYNLSWYKFGEIHNMLAASYAGGWLNFINPGTMGKIIAYLAKLDIAAVLFTLVFETMVIFALWHRKLLLAILFLAVFFHIMVVLQSGIFIWHWILVDLAFIQLVLKLGKNSKLSIISKNKLVWLLSSVLIVSSHLWSGAAKLAWHDAPVSYNFFVDVYDENNNVTRLTAANFAPYEYTFTIGSLKYLSDQPLMPISWGATRNLILAESLSNAKSTDEVKAIAAEYAVDVFDPAISEVFDKFVVKYLTNKQIISSSTNWFDFVPAPLFLYSGNPNRNPLENSIVKVNVILKTTWFDGNQFVVIDESILRDITVDSVDY